MYKILCKYKKNANEKQKEDDNGLSLDTIIRNNHNKLFNFYNYVLKNYNSILIKKYKYPSNKTLKTYNTISYDKGFVIQNRFFKNKELHRKNGPSSMTFDKDDNDIIFDYCHNGIYRNYTEGPGNIIYFSNGKIKRKEYYNNNYLHNENGPAITKYHENGEIYSESYYNNGIAHRDGYLPAYITWYINGNIKYEEFYKNGKLHSTVSDDGKLQPSVVEYSKNKIIILKNYHINGNPRIGIPPALEEYYDNGNLKKEKFYDNPDNYRDIYYHESGKKRLENHFIDNIRVKEIIYNTNGIMKKSIDH